MSAGCKQEKPWRKGKHDNDEKEEVKDRKHVAEAEKNQTRVDRDKYCHGIVHTIVGGLAASS